MRVAFVGTDLMIGSRIAAAADAAGAELVRADTPEDLPPDGLDVVLVDWAQREPGWDASLGAWCAGAPDSRVILYGPHVDLEAHAAARAAGLGPMWARSRLLGALPELFTSAPARGT